MSVALVSPRDRWIAGVCSGLARRFGRSPNFVRLLFVVSCMLPGRSSCSTSYCGSSCPRSDQPRSGFRGRTTSPCSRGKELLSWLSHRLLTMERLGIAKSLTWS
jgi:hypothetical protein